MVVTAESTASPEAPRAPGVARPTPRRRRRGLAGNTGWRALVLVALLVVLAFVLLASIAYGSKEIPLGVVLDALFAFDDQDPDHLIVRSLRVPRTLVGAMVGVGLGLAGALMQGLTRNPLADPGILGVNAGAALFVVIGIHSFGIANLTGYVWFAFVGAGLASLLVYTIGSIGREGATPVKLALAGAAITAFLGSITSAILLLDITTLDQFRFWAVGSLANRNATIAAQLAPFIALGTVLAMSAGSTLNAMALGDDVARSLGQRLGATRVVLGVTIVLLVGAAVSAAGPIAFVGLTVPHLARAIVGPDYRWILPYSAVLAAILLVGADIIGRVVDRPSEIQVGIVTAVLGAPFFIALVRYRKPVEL